MESFRVNASDGARELAEQYNIDLHEVEIDGTGPEGRIYKDDVEKYIEDNNLLPDLD